MAGTIDLAGEGLILILHMSLPSNFKSYKKVLNL
jgi:hypothetical protein